MTKVDFTMADLQSTMLGYSEGMLVNEDVLRTANRAWQIVKLNRTPCIKKLQRL